MRGRGLQYGPDLTVEPITKLRHIALALAIFLGSVLVAQAGINDLPEGVDPLGGTAKSTVSSTHAELDSISDPCNCWALCNAAGPRPPAPQLSVLVGTTCRPGRPPSERCECQWQSLINFIINEGWNWPWPWPDVLQ